MSDEDADRDDSTSEEIAGHDDPPDDSVQAVVGRVRDRVDPDESERERLEAVADRLLERAAAAATERCPDADVLQAGSSARGTWISGDRDIDVFVRFPPELDRETLEAYGLEVGHETLPDGHESTPNTLTSKANSRGSTSTSSPVSDSTPRPRSDRRSTEPLSYAVSSRTARRRTRSRHPDDERVSERDRRLRKRPPNAGFSGYLTELLVCEYGGFRPFLEAVRNWQPPIRLDPEDHGRTTFDDPLVVIDPPIPSATSRLSVRPRTSPVSNTTRVRSSMIPTPSSSRPTNRSHWPNPNSGVTSSDATRRRSPFGSTHPISSRTSSIPNFASHSTGSSRNSTAGVSTSCVRRRSLTAPASSSLNSRSTNDRPSNVTRAASSRQNHSREFYDAYVDDPDVYGPFLDGDRYVAERGREFTTARAFLESDQLFDVALGAHVATALGGTRSSSARTYTRCSPSSEPNSVRTSNRRRDHGRGERRGDRRQSADVSSPAACPVSSAGTRLPSSARTARSLEPARGRRRPFPHARSRSPRRSCETTLSNGNSSNGPITSASGTGGSCGKATTAIASAVGELRDRIVQLKQTTSS